MSYNKYFFIGVGGIGMSSIANYLIDTKNIVFGYDRSSNKLVDKLIDCLLYTSPSPRDVEESRMASSA